MLQAYTSSFFDELEKIATAGDLMTPAVVSDSATVDGPPATAFPKRRVGKKKEAADLKKFVQQSVGKLKKVPKTVHAKTTETMTKGYVKSPRLVQKGVDNATKLLLKIYG